MAADRKEIRHQDATRESTPRDFVPKASHVKGLIKCTGLWFAGGKCGCGWQLVQINVRPPTRLVGSGKCYIPEDSDDDELLDQLNKSDATRQEGRRWALLHRLLKKIRFCRGCVGSLGRGR